MLRQTLFIVIATVAMLALVTYSVVADTGPIGWLNALQAAVFGGYSGKLSFLLLAVPAMLAGALLWLLLWPDALSIAAAPPKPTAPSTYRTAAIVAVLVGVPLSWGASYGYAWWQARSDDADAAASYPLLDLSASPSRAAAGAMHLAVLGRPLPDRVAEKTEGSRRIETLLPIVAPGWSEGDPVHYVIRIAGAGEPGARSLTREADGSVRVRVGGSVATAAHAVFARMGAPLADDAVVLAPMPPAESGGAAGPAALDTTSVVIFGSAGTAVAVLFAVLCAITALRERRGHRDTASAAS